MLFNVSQKLSHLLHAPNTSTKRDTTFDRRCREKISSSIYFLFVCVCVGGEYLQKVNFVIKIYAYIMTMSLLTLCYMYKQFSHIQLFEVGGRF